ncbi:MAG: hypothetical protein SGBAC_012292, partial [Bacillariaceae sp.]
ENDAEYLSSPTTTPKKVKLMSKEEHETTAPDDTTTPETTPTPSKSKVTPHDGEISTPHPKSPIGDINCRGNRFRQDVLDQHNQKKSTSEEGKQDLSAKTPNMSNVRNPKTEETSKEDKEEQENDAIMSHFSSEAPSSLESFPESPIKNAGKKRALEENEDEDELADPKKTSKSTRQMTLSSWFVKK